MPSCSRDEYVFAFLNDTYIMSNPKRAVEVFELLAAAFEHHAGIRINFGKTKMWNATSVKPVGVNDLGFVFFYGWPLYNLNTDETRISMPTMCAHWSRHLKKRGSRKTN